MRYLITGGAGFIASHLADSLVETGHEVVALDNLSTGRRVNVAHLEGRENFTFVQGSVLDELLVDELAHDADVIVHLAAAVGVELIVRRPLQTLITNIRGSEIVLAAAHRYGVKTLIASTSEIYGKNTSGPLSEDSDRILGSTTIARWGYSTSKAVDEILAYAYHRERDLPTVVIRLFNTVGPRQSGAYGMVLPRFVNRALSRQPLLVYGDGAQTRCFVHVGDVVRGILGLLDEPRAIGDVFNIGGTEEISIRALAERVVASTGSMSLIQSIPYTDVYDAGFEDMRRRVPDTAKIRSLIGWTPQFSLDEIIQDVTEGTRSDTPAIKL